MITALLIGAGALWLLGRKRNAVSGIGAVRKQKRRIWSEIESAQRLGIDLTDPDGWKGKKGKLDTIAFTHEALPSSKQVLRSGKPAEQVYFNQLRRAYKSIAGTNLPYDESVVRNENGDVILVYRDYHMENLPRRAAEYILEESYANMANSPSNSAFWATAAKIALGAKFVWNSSKDKIHRGVEQMAFGKLSPEERKKRISYLATPAKGGKYIDEFAHELWEHTDMVADDHDITNGVTQALLEFDTRAAAADACMEEFLKAHQVEEPLLYQDVPF